MKAPLRRCKESEVSTGQRSQLGVLGMGTMGRNLALNLVDHGGFHVAAWNGGAATLERLGKDPFGPKWFSTTALQAFVASLKKPRRTILMGTAGAAVDELVAKLAPLLETGDIIVDGG